MRCTSRWLRLDSVAVRHQMTRFYFLVEARHLLQMISLHQSRLNHSHIFRMPTGKFNLDSHSPYQRCSCIHSKTVRHRAAPISLQSRISGSNRGWRFNGLCLCSWVVTSAFMGASKSATSADAARPQPRPVRLANVRRKCYY